MRLWQNKDTIFFASFAAFLGVFCDKKLLTAKDPKKAKLRRYQNKRGFFHGVLWKYNLNLLRFRMGQKKRQRPRGALPFFRTSECDPLWRMFLSR